MTADSKETCGELVFHSAEPLEAAAKVGNGSGEVGGFALDIAQRVLRRQIRFLKHAYPEQEDNIDALGPGIVAACGTVLPDIIQTHAGGFHSRRRNNLPMHQRRLRMWFSGVTQTQIAREECVQEPTEIGRVRRQFAAAVGEAVPYETLMEAALQYSAQEIQ